MSVPSTLLIACVVLVGVLLVVEFLGRSRER
jgi:hypothetical protein